MEDSHIKKQWLAWILLAILASSNVHAECNKGSCQNGKGTFTWPTGDVYEGDFVSWVRTGKGTLTWANGDVYVGDFVDGNRTGKGTYTWASGTIEEGYYLDGNLVGTLAERELAEKKERERKDKYDGIYNACLLDKSSSVDMQISSLEVAVKKTCESIAENPSWLETFKYE